MDNKVQGKNEIAIEQLTDKNNKYFETICNWWGKQEGDCEKVRSYMEYTLCRDRIPQTYVAALDHEAVGMYQIGMSEFGVRPDLYPWLMFVYVDEKYRGQGFCTILMNHAIRSFKGLGLKEVFLYTPHIGLYEKYGWNYMEDIKTWKKEIRRLYKLVL